MESELVTLAEAAEYLRLKISTLRAWRSQRKIPFLKIGGRVMVHRADLAAFVAGSVIPARKAA